jgi:hypothetical protein
MESEPVKKILEIRHRHDDVPPVTKLKSVANKIAETLYGKPLNQCLGTAQQVRKRVLEQYDIHVFIPPMPDDTPVKKEKKVKKGMQPKTSSKKAALVETKKQLNFYESQEIREFAKIRGYITSMISHAKNMGVSIKKMK